MARVKVLVLVWALFLLMQSCGTSEEPVRYLPGSDYFPLKAGAFYIYDVDSTAILFNVATEFHFQVRHMITDSFLNAESGYTYVINREKRADETQPWQPAGTWTARVNNRQCILTEGNTSFVKLIFPIEKGLIWDGNGLNALAGPDNCGEGKCDEYEVEDLLESFTLDSGSQFENVVIINQNDDADIVVGDDIRSEVYARNIGLIQKESIVTFYCTDGDCLGEQFIDKGTLYKQRLIEYGGL